MHSDFEIVPWAHRDLCAPALPQSLPGLSLADLMMEQLPSSLKAKPTPTALIVYPVMPGTDLCGQISSGMPSVLHKAMALPSLYSAYLHASTESPSRSRWRPTSPILDPTSARHPALENQVLHAVLISTALWIDALGLLSD